MVGHKGPLDIERVLEEVRTYLPEPELELIQRAYDLAAGAHFDQIRISGEPYIQHCLAVAQMLAELRLDSETLAAALLHDTLEDSETSIATIKEQFGEQVANLVDGVTKLSVIDRWTDMESNRKDEEAESLRKMFLAMVDDVRVVLIKLTDRLHNMRTLSVLSPQRRRRIAQETLDIFAPLANRLGIWQIKWELEDLSFRYLYPEKYREIAHKVNQRRVDREHYIEDVIDILKGKLREQNIEAEISGRVKHIYSIYRKMMRKGVDFDQIYDVQAVRVIVDTIPSCYAVLGTVHTLWSPIRGEFDDFIATPKDNMYRSIHTAVLSPSGKPLEVQIRTRDMHRVAEYGIAAHWRYKEQAKRDIDFENKIAWLRHLMEWRQEVTDAHEFIDSLKTDVFEDRVYVFSPKGTVFDLPAGSTPIDFAYNVHTEIGHRCRGAKVDGRLRPLGYRLKTGEQVEILTSKRGGPSRDWLNPNLGYVKTARARQKIRQWFRRRDREENIAQGRAQLERELRRLSLGSMSFESIAKRFNYDKLDDFLAAIGYGDINSHHVGTKLLEEERAVEIAAAEEARLKEPAKAPSTTSDVRVKGVGSLLTQLARCCNPVPGDEIAGYITRGRGVSIHRQDCPNLLAGREPERLISVDWEQKKSGESYPVKVRVRAWDRDGLLRDIAAAVADEGVGLSAVNVTTHKQDNVATFSATLEISGIAQLSRLLAKIELLPNVLEASRQVG
jgi:GTP pyrophosphokinase